MASIRYEVIITTYGEYCNEDEDKLKCHFILGLSKEGFGDYTCALFGKEDGPLDREFYSNTPYRCKKCLTLDLE